MDEMHLRFLGKYLGRARSKPIVKICISDKETSTSESYIEDDETSLNGSVLYIVDSYSVPSSSCFLQTRETYLHKATVPTKIIHEEDKASPNVSNIPSSKPAVTQTPAQYCSKQAMHPKRARLKVSSPAEELIGQFNPDYPELQRNQEYMSQEFYEKTRLLEKSTSHTFNASITVLQPESKTTNDDKINNDPCKCACNCDEPEQSKTQSESRIHATSENIALISPGNVEAPTNNTTSAFRQSIAETDYNKGDDELQAAATAPDITPPSVQESPSPKYDNVIPEYTNTATGDSCEEKATSFTDRCFDENVEAPTKKGFRKMIGIPFFGKKKSDAKRNKIDSDSKLLVKCECYEPRTKTDSADTYPGNGEAPTKNKAKKKEKSVVYCECDEPETNTECADSLGNGEGATEKQALKEEEAPLSVKEESNTQRSKLDSSNSESLADCEYDEPETNTDCADTYLGNGEVATKTQGQKQEEAPLSVKEKSNTQGNKLDSSKSKPLVDCECDEPETNTDYTDTCLGNGEVATRTQGHKQEEAPLSVKEESDTQRSKLDSSNSKSLADCESDEPETNTDCADTYLGNGEVATKTQGQIQEEAPLSVKEKSNTQGNKLASSKSKPLVDCECDEPETNTDCANTCPENGVVATNEITPCGDSRTHATLGNKPDSDSTNELTGEPCPEGCKGLKIDIGITGACPVGAYQQNLENVGEPRRNMCKENHSKTTNETTCDCCTLCPCDQPETTPSSYKKLDLEITTACPEEACQQNKLDTEPESETNNILTRGSDSFYKLRTMCKQNDIKKEIHNTQRSKLDSKSSKSLTDCECDQLETNTERADTNLGNGEVPTTKKAQKKKKAPLFGKEKGPTHESKLDSKSSKSQTDCDCDKPETNTGSADTNPGNGEVPTKIKVQKKKKTSLFEKVISFTQINKLDSKSSKSQTDCDCDKPETNTGSADTKPGNGKVPTKNKAQKKETAPLFGKEKGITQGSKLDSRSSKSLTDSECDEPETDTECADTYSGNGEAPTKNKAQKNKKTPFFGKEKGITHRSKLDSRSSKSQTECECDEPETNTECADTSFGNGEVPTKKNCQKKRPAPLYCVEKCNTHNNKLDSRSSKSLTDCECDEPEANTKRANTNPRNGKVPTKKMAQTQEKTSLFGKEKGITNGSKLDSRSSKSLTDCECGESETDTERAGKYTRNGKVPTKKKAQTKEKTPSSGKNKSNTQRSKLDSRSSKSLTDSESDESETDTERTDTSGNGKVPTKKKAQTQEKTPLFGKNKSNTQRSKLDSRSSKSLTDCECDESETDTERAENSKVPTKKKAQTQEKTPLSGKNKFNTQRSKLDSRSSKSLTDCECGESETDTERAENSRVPTKKKAQTQEKTPLPGKNKSTQRSKLDSKSSKSQTEPETNTERADKYLGNGKVPTKNKAQKKKKAPFYGKEKHITQGSKLDSSSSKSETEPETNKERADTYLGNGEVPTKNKAQKKKKTPLYRKEKDITQGSKLDSRSSKSLTECECDEPETNTERADRYPENGKVPAKKKAQTQEKTPLSGKEKSNTQRSKLDSRSSKSLTDCECDEPKTDTETLDTGPGNGKVPTKNKTKKKKKALLCVKEKGITQRSKLDTKRSKSLSDCDCDEPGTNTDPGNGKVPIKKVPTNKKAQAQEKTPLSDKEKSNTQRSKLDSRNSKLLTDCDCDQLETNTERADTNLGNGEVPTTKKAQKKKKAPLFGKEKGPTHESKLDSKSSKSQTDCDCDKLETNTGSADTNPGNGEIPTKIKAQKKKKTSLFEKVISFTQRNKLDSKGSKSQTDCDCDKPETNTGSADTNPGNGKVPTKNKAQKKKKTPFFGKDKGITDGRKLDSRSSKSLSDCECDEPETNTERADTNPGNGKVPTKNKAQKNKKTPLLGKEKGITHRSKLDSRSSKSLSDCDCDEPGTDTEFTDKYPGKGKVPTKNKAQKNKKTPLSGKEKGITHGSKLDSRSSKSLSHCDCDEPGTDTEFADTYPGKGKVPTKNKAQKNKKAPLSGKEKGITKESKLDSRSSKSLNDCECDEPATKTERADSGLGNGEVPTKKKAQKKKKTPLSGKEKSDQRNKTDSGSTDESETNATRNTGSKNVEARTKDGSKKKKTKKSQSIKSLTSKNNSDTGNYYNIKTASDTGVSCAEECSRESTLPKDDSADFVIKISVNQNKDSDSRIGTCQKKRFRIKAVSKAFNKLCKKANGNLIPEETDSLKNCSSLGDKSIGERESAKSCNCKIVEICKQIRCRCSEKQTKKRKIPCTQPETCKPAPTPPRSPSIILEAQQENRNDSSSKLSLCPPRCPSSIAQQKSCHDIPTKPAPCPPACFCKTKQEGIKLLRKGTAPNISKAYASHSAHTDGFTTIKPYQPNRPLRPVCRSKCGTRCSRSDVFRRNSPRPSRTTSKQSGLTIVARRRLISSYFSPFPPSHSQCITPCVVTRESESLKCYDHDSLDPGNNGHTNKGYMINSRGYLVPLSSYSTKHRTQTRNTGVGSNEIHQKPDPDVPHKTKCVSTAVSANKLSESRCDQPKVEEVPTLKKLYFSFLRLVRKYITRKDKTAKKEKEIILEEKQSTLNGDESCATPCSDNIVPDPLNVNENEKNETLLKNEQSILDGDEPCTTPRRFDNIVLGPNNAKEKQVTIYWEKPSYKGIQANNSENKPCFKKPCCTLKNNKNSFEKPCWSNTDMLSKNSQNFHCNMISCPTGVQHVKKNKKSKKNIHHNDIQVCNSQMSCCNLHCPVKHKHSKKSKEEPNCCHNDIQASINHMSSYDLYRFTHKKANKIRKLMGNFGSQTSNTQMSCCNLNCPVKDTHPNKTMKIKQALHFNSSDSKDKFQHKDIQASNSQLSCCNLDCPVQVIHPNKNKISKDCCHNETEVSICKTSCCNSKCPIKDKKANKKRKSKEKFRCCHSETELSDCQTFCCNSKFPIKDKKAKKKRESKEKYNCSHNETEVSSSQTSCCNSKCRIKDKKANKKRKSKEKYNCCHKHSKNRKIKSCYNLHCPVKGHHGKHANISRSNQEVCSCSSENLILTHSSNTSDSYECSGEVSQDDSGLSLKIKAKLSWSQLQGHQQSGQSCQTGTSQSCPEYASELPSRLLLADLAQRMQELSAEASRTRLDSSVVERNLKEVSDRLNELRKRLPGYSPTPKQLQSVTKQDEAPALSSKPQQTKKSKTRCCRKAKKPPKLTKVKTSNSYKGDSSGVITGAEYEKNKKKDKKSVTVSTEVVVKPKRKKKRTSCECRTGYDSGTPLPKPKYSGLKIEMKGKCRDSLPNLN